VSKASASQLPTGSLPAALVLFAGTRAATVGRLLREPGRSPFPDPQPTPRLQQPAARLHPQAGRWLLCAVGSSPTCRLRRY